MCRTHESTSALAWLGAAAVGVVHPSVGALIVGVVVAAGAGVAPDFDHHDATVAHCLPPVSGWMAGGVRWRPRWPRAWHGRTVVPGVEQLAGGHRHRTHTLAAAAGLGAGVWLVEAVTVPPWWTLAVVWVCALWAVRVLGPKSVRHGVVASVVVAGGIGWAAAVYVRPGAWLWQAVTIGYVAHLFGDCLSVKGAPLLWPVTSYRFRLPVVPVNSIREHIVGGVAGVTAVWMLASGCASTLQTPPPPATVQTPSSVPVSGCHATGPQRAGVLPDPRCTPGEVNPAVTQQNLPATICKTGWTATVRPPVSYTNGLKVRQMAAYGDRGPPSAFEEDHRVPLEVGGAPSDPRNLWPEPGRSPNPKDRIEGAVRRQVCTGRMTLAQGQAVFLGDWWTYERIPER